MSTTGELRDLCMALEERQISETPGTLPSIHREMEPLVVRFLEILEIMAELDESEQHAVVVTVMSGEALAEIRVARV